MFSEFGLFRFFGYFKIIPYIFGMFVVLFPYVGCSFFVFVYGSLTFRIGLYIFVCFSCVCAFFGILYMFALCPYIFRRFSVWFPHFFSNCYVFVSHMFHIFPYVFFICSCIFVFLNYFRIMIVLMLLVCCVWFSWYLSVF
jgi:hypothetical protein